MWDRKIISPVIALSLLAHSCFSHNLHSDAFEHGQLIRLTEPLVFADDGILNRSVQGIMKGDVHEFVDDNSHGEAESDIMLRRLLKASLQESACDVCAENWFLILGAGGRTGSTTALEMFAQFPGWEITGEHSGMLFGLLGAFKRLAEKRKTRDMGAWKRNKIGWIRLRCHAHQVIRSVVLGEELENQGARPTVLGFKEIRYCNSPMLPFIMWLFPCARIIFTYRKDPTVFVKQNKFRKTVDMNEVWKNESKFALAVTRKFGHRNQMAMIPVEESGPQVYNEVLHDLLRVRGCEYTRVLRFNMDGSYSKDDLEDLVKGACDFSSMDFRLSGDQIKQNFELWNEIASELGLPGLSEYYFLSRV